MKMKLYLFFLLSWVYVINMGAETYVQLMNPNDSDSCTTGLIYLNTSDQAPLSDSTKSSDSNKKIPQDSIGIRNSVPNEQGITIFNQGRQWGIPRGTTNGAITCKQDGTWDWLVRPVVSYETTGLTNQSHVPSCLQVIAPFVVPLGMPHCLPWLKIVIPCSLGTEFRIPMLSCGIFLFESELLVESDNGA